MDRFPDVWIEAPGGAPRVSAADGAAVGEDERALARARAMETIEIPVQGIIGSEISIVGPRWYADTNTVHLGVIDPAKGLERTLLIRVGGVNRKEVKFKLGTVVPDLLRFTTDLRMVLYGVVLIAAMLLFPGGLGGWLDRRRVARWRRPRRVSR